MGAEVDQSTIDAIRDAVAGEVRKDVVETVRAAMDEWSKASKKEAPPNPNADRFADQAQRLESKIGSSLDRAAKQGYEPGIRFARVVQACIAAKCNVSGVHDQLRKWGDNQISEGIERAMELESPKYGGILVPEEYSMEMIELLRPTSVLAQAQPRRISLRGKLHIPQKKVGTQSYWGDPRGRSTQASRPQLGMVTLDEKALTAVAALPKRLIQLASINVAQFLRDEILEEMGVKIDYAFFNGAGNTWEPQGYLNLPATGLEAPNWLDINGALTWDLPIAMRAAALKANSTFIRPYWFMAPDLEALLMKVTPNSGTNPFWFQQMTQAGTLLGAPYISTNHVPVAATSNNPTTLTFMDMAQYLLGEDGQGYEVSETDVGGYYDETGAVALPFANGEQAVKVVYRVDFAPRNPKCLTIGKRIQTT